MKVPDVCRGLRGRLIVSCQADPDDAFHGLMDRFALAAVTGGAAGIRANGPADVPRAKAEGKLGIIVGQQNSNHFRTVDDVDAFYKLGQRVSQLTYRDNALGGGSVDPAEKGLTAYGAQVLARMNQLGMAAGGALAVVGLVFGRATA